LLLPAPSFKIATGVIPMSFPEEVNKILARQEELIDYLFERGFEGMGELFMNLSPYFKERQDKPGIAKENKENEL
jgi:hypothetical protein